MPTLTKRTLSLVHGPDQDCLRDLINLHATPNPVILDLTYGRGTMWRGLPWQPNERLDCRPLPDVTVVGDFRHLPEEWNERFDIVVFDPPMMPDAGAGSRYIDRFGVDLIGRGANISDLFEPVLREAHRVLRRHGIVLTKLTDIIHRGRYQWHGVDFINVVRQIDGLTACDMLIKDEPRSSTLIGHNWKVARHVRRAHVCWYVVRKGSCAKPDGVAA